MKCDEQFIQLYEAIKEGGTRYSARRRFDTIREEVNEFGELCDPQLARFLHVEISYGVGDITLEEASSDLQTLLDAEGLGDFARMYLLAEISRLRLRKESVEKNFARRREAVGLAERTGRFIEATLLRIAWLFATLTVGQRKDALALVDEIEQRLSDIEPGSTDPRLDEALSRFYSHKASLSFAQAAEAKEGVQLALIESGGQNYERALGLVQENDHRRVNTLTEWAERLCHLAEQIGYAKVSGIDRLLTQAQMGLDSHYCNPCLGYFYLVQARHLRNMGTAVFNFNPTEALDRWSEAEKSAELSLRHYERIGHHYASESTSLLFTIEAKLAMNDIPDRIFLSHKSEDKSLVRRFQQALEAIGYRCWLDEVALPPYSTLSRGIYEGILKSCAIVFFITPNFKDERYIKREIDLAQELQLERGEERFRIIPLVFGKETPVPDVVRRLTRYAVFEDELSALTYLITWLPLVPGTVHFRDDPRTRVDKEQ